MAKAHHVKKARKDYPEHGIKAGEGYWWWKFMVGGRGGSKHFSKTRPKQSQLTQSEFWSAIYSLQEREQPKEFDDLEPEVDGIIGELETIRDECQDKFDNLPDSLQNGSSGELQQERVDACEEAISTLQSIDFSKEDGLDEDELQNRADEIWQEVDEALSGISCE